MLNLQHCGELIRILEDANQKVNPKLMELFHMAPRKGGRGRGGFGGFGGRPRGGGGGGSHTRFGGGGGGFGGRGGGGGGGRDFGPPSPPRYGGGGGFGGRSNGSEPRRDDRPRKRSRSR